MVAAVPLIMVHSAFCRRIPNQHICSLSGREFFLKNWPFSIDLKLGWRDTYTCYHIYKGGDPNV